MERPIGRVIVVPGLLEPCAALFPLKRLLRKHCPRVDCFRDRLAFRDLDRSVDRLSEMLCDDVPGEPGDSIALVTHSFGDWVARNAIGRTPQHRVHTLISITPALRPGPLLHLLRFASGNLLPEVRVIMDAPRAAANIDCNAVPRRIVIWAKADACVRPIDLAGIREIEIQHFLATHLTVILQPNVLKMIERCVFSDVAKDSPSPPTT